MKKESNTPTWMEKAKRVASVAVLTVASLVGVAAIAEQGTAHATDQDPTPNNLVLPNEGDAPATPTTLVLPKEGDAPTPAPEMAQAPVPVKGNANFTG